MKIESKNIIEEQGDFPSDMSVMVVDDDPQIRLLIRTNLEKRGCQHVYEAMDGTAAINQMAEIFPDLILLDLAMPRMGGIAVCDWVRKRRQDIPIIVLSALYEEDLMIEALDAGADDYVKKPFKMNILMAKIRAVMRRIEALIQTGRERNRLVIGGFVVDFSAKRAFVDGEDIRLTRTEFALLSELARNPDLILSHDELLERVWGPEYRGSNHYLHVYLGRVRKKMGDIYNKLLETVPGIGYTLYGQLTD